MNAAAMLLESGADPNGITLQFQRVGSRSFLRLLVTPLTAGIRYRFTSIVRLLLEHGADPNLAAEYDGDAFSPLLLAILVGRMDIAELLNDESSRDGWPITDTSILWEVDVGSDFHYS